MCFLKNSAELCQESGAATENLLLEENYRNIQEALPGSGNQRQPGVEDLQNLPFVFLSYFESLMFSLFFLRPVKCYLTKSLKIHFGTDGSGPDITMSDHVCNKL
ncbi:MAG TPA: hypothetical protein ENI15_02750 [Spirochaetes bacterium]|nr:hypothetical protein [Spirochaetota bacterium]